VGGEKINEDVRYLRVRVEKAMVLLTCAWEEENFNERIGVVARRARREQDKGRCLRVRCE